MLGKRKPKPEIDKDQLELIQNAQRRVKQKKRLYLHFVIFLIGAIFLIVANTVLGIGKDFTILGKEWFVFAIIFWLFLFLYHLFNVFVTNKFMGKAWEQQQMDKLFAKQRERIDKMKEGLKYEEQLMAESEVHNEERMQKSTNNLTIIVAAGENDAIGKDNKLIWHLKDDLKRFKSLTSGHHIIMGRKTFESFPQPLPNRKHIVITRNKQLEVPEGVEVVFSLQEAIELAKADTQPFVIGGGDIYAQAMPLATTIELTRVHHRFEQADTFFPSIDSSIWEEVNKKVHDADDEHQYAFSFITYKRR